ncbi:hypothetical protein, partial [Enterococcus faecium]|uniref:hypothetical protein n=1 Tax=Enterococcus faecium TaxID=1352 RepID=UPI003AAF5962
AKATSGWRVFFDALALAAGMLFLALVLHPAIEYALDEAAIVTPALEIPNIWRVMAVPVGLGLMLFLGVLRLGRLAPLKEFLLALVLLGVIAGVLVGAKPLLMAMGNYKLIVFFVLLVG